VSYVRKARYHQVQFKRRVRRIRRRLKGFQTPGWRRDGDSLVADRDHKQNELNEMSILFAIIAGIVGGIFVGSVFGPLGFLAGGLFAFGACANALRNHRPERG
jgi:hypothetical protein